MNKTWLNQKYWDEGLSVKAIAKEAKKDKATVLYWMNKLGIKRRTRSEANALFCEQNQSLYELENHSRWKGGTSHHTARKLWEKQAGISIPEGFYVHHIDGDKTNNRINNLALMTNSGHVRLHRIMDKLMGKKFFGRDKPKGIEVVEK